MRLKKINLILAIMCVIWGQQVWGSSKIKGAEIQTVKLSLQQSKNLVIRGQNILKFKGKKIESIDLSGQKINYNTLGKNYVNALYNMNLRTTTPGLYISTELIFIIKKCLEALKTEQDKQNFNQFLIGIQDTLKERLRSWVFRNRLQENGRIRITNVRTVIKLMNALYKSNDLNKETAQLLINILDEQTGDINDRVNQNPFMGLFNNFYLQPILDQPSGYNVSGITVASDAALYIFKADGTRTNNTSDQKTINIGKSKNRLIFQRTPEDQMILSFQTYGTSKGYKLIQLDTSDVRLQEMFININSLNSEHLKEFGQAICKFANQNSILTTGATIIKGDPVNFFVDELTKYFLKIIKDITRKNGINTTNMPNVAPDNYRKISEYAIGNMIYGIVIEVFERDKRSVFSKIRSDSGYKQRILQRCLEIVYRIKYPEFVDDDYSIDDADIVPETTSTPQTEIEAEESNLENNSPAVDSGISIGEANPVVAQKRDIPDLDTGKPVTDQQKAAEAEQAQTAEAADTRYFYQKTAAENFPSLFSKTT